MIRLILFVSIFWLLIHFFNFYLRKTTTKINKTTTPRTTFDLSFFSFHLSTTSFNHLPELLIKPFSKKRSKGFTSTGALRSFWDIGAVLGVFGILIAQAVLLWTAVKSFSTLWSLLRLNGHEVIVGTAKKLIKRMIESTPSVASSLIIRPVIPGLTLPLSALPLLLLALLSSQAFHELGHGMAAASEFIPVLSTGLHLYIILPTFYVSLPESSPSRFSELRIATAGVWHNLVLIVFVLGLSERGLGVGKWFEKTVFKDVEGGLLVVSVDSSSPLSHHLSPYSLVTHLNDLELDSSTNPLDLWSSYLSGTLPASSTYENLGWCLPLTSFSTSLNECCLPSSSSSSSIDNSQLDNPRLCFSIPPISSKPTTPPQSLSACLNPLPYFPPSKSIPSRCLTSANCEEKDVGCARPLDGEKVLRLGVLSERGQSREEGRSRTIVWQGDWKGVLEQVSVSSVLPRYWFVPVAYPRTIERFYSHTVSLSLALAFFNLLPLPHLDGSHIVHSFFLCLSSFSDDTNLEAGLHSTILLSSTTGLLEKVLNRMSRIRSIRKFVLGSERIERGLRIWTVLIASVTIVVSLIVEVGSHYLSNS